ncbi:hypothetical protein, partial [Rhodoplanes roseus]|uniref:hypothetical protein n=1 Tax=Rhodoplanes roseus TaxID=29409 RepID=UPI001AECA066
SATALLGGKARGSNFRVDETVRSDGFLQLFSLSTSYGQFQVEGRELLTVRLDELRAVALLEQMNKSQAFLDAARAAAMKPVDLAVGLIGNPVGTIEKGMSGVGALFSRIGSAAGNVGHGRDKPGEALLGVSAARRQLAQRLRVDPYTDFKPLADALNEAARVIALGNLSVSGAFMAIPGAAGMAVSGSKTGQDLGQLALDKAPSELRDLNRASLTAMGVPVPITAAFLDNTVFTPTDQTVIVTALARMKGVKNQHIFVARAAQAGSRDLAFFFRRRAELIADHHLKTEALAEFVDVRGLAVNRTRGGTVVAVVPFDMLAWTEPVSGLVAAMDDDIRRGGLGKAIEIRVTGGVTERARQGLREHGWTLVETAAP